MYFCKYGRICARSYVSLVGMLCILRDVIDNNTQHASTQTDMAELLDSIQTRLEQLSSYVSTEDNAPALSMETLLDTFVAVYTDCKSATTQNEQIQGYLSKCIIILMLDDSLISKIQNLRVNTGDFDTIKTLATGAVGRVCLVRSKRSRTVYAMKVLKKQDLLTRREVV